MFFRQILNEDLGCASYIIADSGEAAVVDPKWEIEEYLQLADEHNFRINHILETHNHADHLSGRGRLAEATGATIHISKKASVEYEHEPLTEDDVVEVGQARIITVATPGHRPEHTTFLIEDTSRDEAPWLILAGDSLFVNDLARPDLAVDPAEGAQDLFHSLRKLLEFEDFTEVWPGHIGGSLCGGADMSEKPGSTIGFERRFNRYLQFENEGEFVRALGAESTPQPPNFERIVELNRGKLLTAPVSPHPLLPVRVRELMETGVVLIDGRTPREYDALHIAGSLNVTMIQSGVGTRAGWVVDPESEIIVTAASDEDARQMVRLLEAVGFRHVRGYLVGGTAAWRATGLSIQTTPAIGVPTLARQLSEDEVVLLDVRDKEEWQSGHVYDSIHIPYNELREGVPEEIRSINRPLAVACLSGIRSSLAASLLRRAGLSNVQHVTDGGIPDLQDEGIELVRE